jgi:O-antigen ligase
VLALLLWYCCTLYWTAVPEETPAGLRGSFQKMMVVWLVWEFAEEARDLRRLLWLQVAGCGVLAVLTLLVLRSPQALVEGRLAAEGADPNDAAYFLSLGLPPAALRVVSERKPAGRWLALSYLPLGTAAVLLTGSRGGFVEALIALTGCAVLLGRRFPRAALLGLPPAAGLAAVAWSALPLATLARLATLPQQLQGGGWNQRWNIWSAGWEAFRRAPLLGSGAGAFVAAARQPAIDTAHNAALSIAVNGGLAGLFLAGLVALFTLRALRKTGGFLRLALGVALLVCLIGSLAATVDESRSTWLLVALIALAGRLGREDSAGLRAVFDAPPPPDGSREAEAPGEGILSPS